MWDPAGVPPAWADSPDTASTAAHSEAVAPIRTDRLAPSARVPSHIGCGSSVDTDAQLERGAGAGRQDATRAGVIRGHVLPAHRNGPAGARAGRDVGYLRRERI